MKSFKNLVLAVMLVAGVHQMVASDNSAVTALINFVDGAEQMWNNPWGKVLYASVAGLAGYKLYKTGLKLKQWYNLPATEKEAARVRARNEKTVQRQQAAEQIFAKELSLLAAELQKCNTEKQQIYAKLREIFEQNLSDDRKQAMLREFLANILNSQQVHDAVLYHILYVAIARYPELQAEMLRRINFQAPLTEEPRVANEESIADAEELTNM